MKARRLPPARHRERRPAMLFLALCAVLYACGSDREQPLEPPPVTPPPVAPPPVEPPPVEPPVRPLPAGVYALSGISPTLPYADLEPFRSIVGTASFVALGESTHTSRGYYVAKDRLIRFMVEEMGFRVVTIESPWLEALPAARYVASCAGTAETALAALNGVWRDASVRDMLRWLCEYNRTHPDDPVTFFGFDIQEPWRSAPALEQFVTAAAPHEVARAEPLRRCLGASHTSIAFFGSQEYRDHVEGRRNTVAHEQCMTGITEMETWLSGNATALAAAASAVAVEEARIALIALRAWQEQLWVPDPGGYQARDFGMSEVLRRLHALHTPGRKTIVWAWNWHIALRYDEVRGFADDPLRHVPRQGARAMGSFLHDAFGADYLPIALIGYRVQMLAGYPPLPLPTSPLAVERRLHELGRDYLLVDLRQPLPDSLLPPGQAYQVSQEWGDPYRQFGALLFLEHSPPMIYLSGQ